MSSKKSVAGRKTPLQIFILSFISLVGLGVAIVLTQHFYDVRSGTSGFKSFCNIGQSMNCDVVAASPSAELIFGLPLSSFVAGWFLALFFISLFAYDTYWRREAVRASFAITLIGSLAAIPTVLIMALQLKTYCLLCFAVDAINISGLGLVWSLKPERFSKQKPDMTKWRMLLGITVASLLVTVIGLKVMDSGTITPPEVSELVDGVLNSPPVAVKISDELPSMGPKNAPITIVEFSDFQCPFCRIGAFNLNSALDRFAGQVRVIFRNFPLDQACNPTLPHTAHPMACEAAKVAVCAHQQGKFEPVYQEFFDKQSLFLSTQPIELVKNLGLDEMPLRACVASADTASYLARDIAEANLLGIKSTPTFYVNGHKMEGADPAIVWVKIIEKLLSSVPKSGN
jgi:protein-disulfide isomerase